jgi:hypothetical protein
MALLKCKDADTLRGGGHELLLSITDVHYCDVGLNCRGAYRKITRMYMYVHACITEVHYCDDGLNCRGAYRKITYTYIYVFTCSHVYMCLNHV